MIIRLFQPRTRNWLLIAEQLDDPQNWDRFVPCHTAGSERWQFDCTVKEEAALRKIQLKPCKDLLTRGFSVFEYDWNTLDDEILDHAMQVAAHLNRELEVGAPDSSGSAHNAA